MTHREPKTSLGWRSHQCRQRASPRSSDGGQSTGPPRRHRASPDPPIQSLWPGGIEPAGSPAVAGLEREHPELKGRETPRVTSQTARPTLASLQESSELVHFPQDVRLHWLCRRGRKQRKRQLATVPADDLTQHEMQLLAMRALVVEEQLTMWSASGAPTIGTAWDQCWARYVATRRRERRVGSEGDLTAPPGRRPGSDQPEPAGISYRESGFRDRPIKSARTPDDQGTANRTPVRCVRHNRGKRRQ
jgi:hypothetical protein